MGKKLAIKGHPTRREEVIKLLEMMGGNDSNAFRCNNPNLIYYVLDYHTRWDYIGPEEIDEYNIFTLEDFLEKFPFKVGDFVRIPEYESEVRILKMKWCPVSEHIEYLVCPKDEEEWFTADELLEDNDNPNKTRDCKKCGLHFGSVQCFDKDCPHNTPKSYAVGLKDGKVIECGVNKEIVMNEIKPLFKTGDVVKLKGCPDKKFFWIVMDVIEDGYIFNGGEKCSFDDQHHYEKTNMEVINAPDITAKVTDKNHKMGPKSKLPSKYYEEKQTKRDIDKSEFIIKHMILPNKMDEKLEYEIIDGYEFDKVENNKIILKPIKPKYPTTYEECWKVRFEVDGETTLEEFHNVSGYYSGPLGALQKLLCCRDAYWKIAGEQMGLDNPWKPDWTNLDQVKYCIWVDIGEFITMINVRGQHILAFPTEEMRDAFFKNFKKEIEQCKEFL